MKVYEVVGRVLTDLGVDRVFGVVGSGNYWFTKAMVDCGATYVPARHENGAATMADAYARMSGRVSAVSVHQGCGLSNALTGITEAAKSRTPMLVLTGDTPPTDQGSNFWIRQDAVARALGVESDAVHSVETAAIDVARAMTRARVHRRTVVLNIPVNLQTKEFPGIPPAVPDFTPSRPAPQASAVDDVTRLLRDSRRPVLVAGRGAVDAATDIARLAERYGALLATTAVARGLFGQDPWCVDVMGGFSTPVAVDLISQSDLVLVFGAGLNNWTTRNGALISAGATVVQVDDDPEAMGRNRPAELGVVADTGLFAKAMVARADDPSGQDLPRWRTDDVAQQIRQGRLWRDVPYEDASTDERIDPRLLTARLDDLIPEHRTVVPDGGNFMGFPAMHLRVQDRHGYCFTQAFQAIGLGIASSIGAALAVPDRTVVCGIGDGGFMMSFNELDTAVRLALPLVVVVYNDDAYGAEIHHFSPDGGALDMVTFPDTDIASIARGMGCEAATVRTEADLDAVKGLLVEARRRSVPLVVDAKITRFPSWVLLAHAAGAMK